MSRGIEFRAWDKRHKRMHYSEDISNYDSLWAIGFHGLPIGVDEDSFKDGVITGWNIDHFLGIMQFTGLIDIHEQKAYYGDIIRFSDSEGQIFEKVLNWNDELCCLMVGEIPYIKLHESGYIQPSKLEFEIIGNIYENPELLEPTGDTTPSEEGE